MERGAWQAAVHRVTRTQLSSSLQMLLSTKYFSISFTSPYCLPLFLFLLSLLLIIPSFSVQFSSVTRSCLTLCDPMDYSTPGFPVHHHLPELAQTHVYRVDDAILPSHSLSSPPSAFNLPQHQGLFK